MRALVKSTILLVLLFFAASDGVGQIVSVMSDTIWHQTPVDNASMNKRIAEAAEQYKEYAPIPRIAFYDVGFPKDKLEFADLNGYGVLLISALSQDQTELPLKRVYVSVGGEEMDLTQYKQTLIKNSDAVSQISKTFGLYRVDNLLLVSGLFAISDVGRTDRFL